MVVFGTSAGSGTAGSKNTWRVINVEIRGTLRSSDYLQDVIMKAPGVNKVLIIPRTTRDFGFICEFG